MVQVIPQSVANIWNQLNIRVVVVGSLCIQILLILFGSRRKYTVKIWVRILVWLAYLSADSVAVTALGMISNFQGSDSGTPEDNRNYIMAFWAPFLILHLGGPDTITAYAMEDNDLWLRHLLNLFIQVSLALYIFLRSWTSSSYRLALLEIPILVAGAIKYGERNWLLRSVSEKKIENMVSEHKNIMPPMDSSNIPDKEEARFLRETSEFFTVVRGSYALRENECFRELSWSISPQSYGRSILLWHIATGICFYDDCDRGKFQESCPPCTFKYFELGMLLSNYMAYVLIMQRFLLPEANFKADCIEYRLIFTEFFKTRADLLSLPELQYLSKVQGYRDVVPLAYEMSTRSKLDLHSDARHYDWRTWLESIRLAQQIQLLEAQGKLTNEKKWKMITEVWIETLCYAALQCPWSAHAMQLRCGGELLTYVHLLMAKLGINNAFRELGGG